MSTLLGLRKPVRLRRGVGPSELENMRQEAAGVNVVGSHKQSRSPLGLQGIRFLKGHCAPST